MGDISRDSDTVELTAPPVFKYGERVVSRYTIRNDGTYCGKDIGEVLAKKGDNLYKRALERPIQRTPRNPF